MASDIKRTALIKLKIQGKTEDIDEFLHRLRPFYPNLDCQPLEETQKYQNNRGRGIIWRMYVRLGMNVRDGKIQAESQKKSGS